VRRPTNIPDADGCAANHRKLVQGQNARILATGMHGQTIERLHADHLHHGEKSDDEGRSESVPTPPAATVL